MSKADGGAVWSSVTRLPVGGRGITATTFFTLAINVSRPWVLQRGDLWPRASLTTALVSHAWNGSCVNGSAAIASGCASVSTSDAQPLPSLQSHSVSPSGAYAHGESPFVLLSTHEILPNGWLVWEEGKYVSVSRRRFRAVEGMVAGLLKVTVGGAAGEIVHLVALRPVAMQQQPGGTEWTVVSKDVQVGANGSATVTIR